MIFLSSFLDATKDVYVNKFLAQQDFFLIVIHSMQGWTATTRKSIWKEPTVKNCLLIQDLKPLRS